MTSQSSTKRQRSAWLWLAAAALLVSVAPAFAGGRQEQQSQPRQTPPRDQGERIELGDSNETNGTTDDESDESERRPAWILGQHDMDEGIEEEISDTIENGYVPVGFDMLGGNVTILYLLTNDIEFTRWTIQRVDDAREMNDTVTVWLRDGWMPLDFALIPGGVSFFLVQTEHEIDSWRIEVIPATSEALERTYGQYQADGYVPYGLAADPIEELFWILFLRAEGNFDIPQVVFDGFLNDDVTEGINERLVNGALPWAMTRLPDRFFVQFVQP
jgi:hypothetical protein